MAVPNSSPQAAARARRFSGKQLRAMQAIGLIPWIRRASTPASASQPNPQRLETPVRTPASTSVPAPFQGWQLRAFRHGAREMMVVGPEAASLLILVEPANEPALPLTDADQKLLRAMLQAIELRLSDVRLAGLSREEDARGSSLAVDGEARDGAELVSVLSDSLRAIMILTSRPEAEFSTPVSCALAHRRLPVWYCPHPAVLRQVPEQKRAAWQMLKAVRRQLGPR